MQRNRRRGQPKSRNQKNQKHQRNETNTSGVSEFTWLGYQDIQTISLDIIPDRMVIDPWCQVIAASGRPPQIKSSSKQRKQHEIQVFR